MLNERLIVQTAPKAHEKNIVYWMDYRVTVLADRLFRVEKNKMRKFRDDATQAVWFRNMEPQDYKLSADDAHAVIETSACRLILYKERGQVCVELKKQDDAKVWLNGAEVEFSYQQGAYVFTVPKGICCWNIGAQPDIQKATVTASSVCSDGASVSWKQLAGAEAYRVQLKAYDADEYETIATVQGTSYTFSGLSHGKYFVRVAGIRADASGAASHPYPVYVTNEKPHCPEGLHVAEAGEQFLASWGAVLGVDLYRLYRRENGVLSLVYEGAGQRAYASDGEYFVTSVNGNGESAPSLVRSTKDALARWDNHPEKGFIRNTRSGEDGYPGFRFIDNGESEILEY